jgi:hypothetical protein
MTDTVMTLCWCRLLPAETVEFSVSYPADKGVPFVRGKPENGPFSVAAVPDADFTIG